MARSSRSRGRRVAAAMVAGMGTASGGVLLALAAPAGTASADTPPYELYCPGTPVGNIVLNDVVTTGTITPTAPASGQQFNLTHYSDADAQRPRRRSSMILAAARTDR